MNILVIHNFYKIPGGEDTVVKNDCELLKQMGHSVFLYTRHNNEIDGFSLFRKLILPFTFVYSFKSAGDVRRIIREKKIDVVMVHNTLSLISPSVYYAATKRGVPVIQVVHNFRLLCPSALLCRDGKVCEDCLKNGLGCALKHRCYRNSFVQTLICVVSDIIHRKSGIYGKLRYICLTEFNKDKLLNMKQIRPEMVYIRPNSAVQKDDWIPYDKRENVVLYAGRLDELKGIKELFEAWKILEDLAAPGDSCSLPGLEICGTGPLKDWCEAFVKDNGLKRIRLCGPVKHDEILKKAACAKAVVLPSKLYEGFPMVIAEAFSVGTPVIGSALGNTGDLVAGGRSLDKITSPCFTKRGALIDPGNMTGSLVETIRNWADFAYDDDAMRDTAGMYGREAGREVLEHILNEVVKQRLNVR